MPAMDEFSIDDVLAEVAVLVKPHFGKGRPADYIPQLADVPGHKFGMAVCTLSGGEHVIGDADEGFSVQSITKVFALGLALNRFGDEVWRRVGKEPSGTPFNHLSQLEAEAGVPRNPFINAGAIAVTDAILAGHQPRETLGEILRFMQYLAADDSVYIDHKVAASEQRTGFRNAALANYMRAFGNIHHPVEQVLGVYFHQCALTMTCQQLARAGDSSGAAALYRGPDQDLVNKEAREWARLFTERSSSAFPGLVIQPIDSLGVPYQICRAR